MMIRGNIAVTSTSGETLKIGLGGVCDFVGAERPTNTWEVQRILDAVVTVKDVASATFLFDGMPILSATAK